jgi:hypothetical protein
LEGAVTITHATGSRISRSQYRWRRICKIHTLCEWGQAANLVDESIHHQAMSIVEQAGGMLWQVWKEQWPMSKNLMPLAAGSAAASIAGDASVKSTPCVSEDKLLICPPTGRDILLTAVVDESIHHQAMSIVEQAGGMLWQAAASIAGDASVKSTPCVSEDKLLICPENTGSPALPVATQGDFGMGEKNILAYFKSPEEAQGAARKLEALRVPHPVWVRTSC